MNRRATRDLLRVNPETPFLFLFQIVYVQLFKELAKDTSRITPLP